jgi:hypothetical protein
MKILTNACIRSITVLKNIIFQTYIIIIVKLAKNFFSNFNSYRIHVCAQKLDMIIKFFFILLILQTKYQIGSFINHMLFFLQLFYLNS